MASSNSPLESESISKSIEDLQNSKSFLRQQKIWELAQKGDSRAMNSLLELMATGDSQEKGLILEAMTQITGRTLKVMNNAIVMSLEDRNTKVRQDAIRDLTRVYEFMSQTIKQLSLMVEDSNTQVRETAQWALQKLN